MSIMLTAGAMVFASLLPGNEAGDYNNKIINNNKKLQRVEEAMRTFMVTNGRRPCPADGSSVPGQANFGLEAATPGSCTGSSPAAPLGPDDATGYIVGGTIPTRSLHLDDSFAFDDFGRRFTYVVDKRATAMASCLALEVNPKTRTGKGGVEIHDSSGTKTDQVMYTYISHGPSGYGAFPEQGSNAAGRVNSGSTNTLKQINAGVDVGANPGTSTFTYSTTNFTDVKIRNDRVFASGNDTGFDDVLFYREDIENTCCLGCICDVITTGADLVVGWFYASGGPYAYQYKCGGWQRLPPGTFDVETGGGITNAKFSGDNQYLGVSSWSGIYIYKQNKTTATFTYLPSSTTVGNTGRPSIAFPSSMDYVMTVGCSTPYISFFKRTGDSFSLLAGQPDTIPPITPSPPWGCYYSYAPSLAAASPDGNYYAAAWDGGAIYMYKRSGDTFSLLGNTKFDPASAVSSCGGGFDFSPDGKYFIGGGTGGGGGDASLCVYKINSATDTFTLLPTQPVAPGYGGTGGSHATFTADSKYVAIGTYWVPDNAIWSIDSSTDTFTLAGPVTALPPGGGTQTGAIGFSQDGKYYVSGSNYYPQLYISNVSAGSITTPKLIDTLPAGANGRAWRH
ncbi:MAG: hypothetical protein QM778_00300 [Myxococcales bacterium]